MTVIVQNKYTPELAIVASAGKRRDRVDDGTVARSGFQRRIRIARLPALGLPRRSRSRRAVEDARRDAPPGKVPSRVLASVLPQRSTEIVILTEAQEGLAKLETIVRSVEDSRGIAVAA